jgi:hypothetical protein
VATVDVVGPPEHDAPSSRPAREHITGETGTTAVVDWPAPGATDDTDPDPAVACNPASGSPFALGATTVTCTATDASDNASSGSFLVTVRQQVEAWWGSPLVTDAVPALIGQLGRTIPLNCGRDRREAPGLIAERLEACARRPPRHARRRLLRVEDGLGAHLRRGPGRRPLAALATVDDAHVGSAVIGSSPTPP